MKTHTHFQPLRILFKNYYWRIFSMSLINIKYPQLDVQWILIESTLHYDVKGHKWVTTRYWPSQSWIGLHFLNWLQPAGSWSFVNSHLSLPQFAIWLQFILISMSWKWLRRSDITINSNFYYYYLTCYGK